jgi:hypothetical protein
MHVITTFFLTDNKICQFSILLIKKFDNSTRDIQQTGPFSKKGHGKKLIIFTKNLWLTPLSPK